LVTLSNHPKKYCILGDFNINIQRENRSNIFQEYINIIESHGAVPIITIPTRVTNDSSTTIDHIITNDFQHQLHPYVIEADLTDHYPQLRVVKAPKRNKNKPNKLLYRDKSKFIPEIFCEEHEAKLLNHSTCQPILHKENFNDEFNKFINIISAMIDQHTPLKPFTYQQRKLHNKPWITKRILTSIKNKGSMFKLFSDLKRVPNITIKCTPIS